MTLRTIPFNDVYWGPIGHGSGDKSEFLMLNGQPLMVWAVSELIYLNFSAQGRSIRKPGVMFRPLLDKDFVSAYP